MLNCALNKIQIDRKFIFPFSCSSLWFCNKKEKLPKKITLNLTWEPSGKVSAAATLLWPQPQEQASALWNHPTDCTLSQRKLGELLRLACPRSHPDRPDRGLTTCGTNAWIANKPYSSAAPHQAHHFYLWFHTFGRRAIRGRIYSSRESKVKGRDSGFRRNFSEKICIKETKSYVLWSCCRNLKRGCVFALSLTLRRKNK